MLPLELPVHVVPARKISAIVKEIPVVNEMPLVSAMQSGVHEVLHRPEGVPQVIQTIHSYAMNSGLQNAPAVQKFKSPVGGTAHLIPAPALPCRQRRFSKAAMRI